jgi:oligoribonuclease (3'-5' exoribonuclease)
MHFIKEITHPQMRISLFEWNSKYIVKFETPQLEQSYKYSVMDFSSLKEIEELVSSSSYQDFVLQTFKNMYAEMAKNID